VIAVAAAMICMAETEISCPMVTVGLDRADHCETGRSRPGRFTLERNAGGLPNPVPA